MSVSSKEADESLVVAIIVESSRHCNRFNSAHAAPLRGAQNNSRPRSPEGGFLVSETNRNEILEERIELVDIARRVRREVSCPLDRPLERGIGSALTMYIPPAGGLQDNKRIRRRLLACESTSDRSDFLGYLGGVDLA
jgi:hypothetical protein